MSNRPAGQRLAIPAGLIVPGTSATIPLQIIALSDSPTPEYKVGIEVVLTNPQTGQSTDPILYEFDTGGEGFFASIPGQSAGAFTLPPAGLGAVFTDYYSGITYSGQAYALEVSLPGATAFAGGLMVPVTVSAGVVTGVIEQLGDWRPGKTASWPIFNHFYGDFGASLQATVVQATPASDTPSNTVPLLSALAQLSLYSDTAQNAGFIVDVGAYPGGGKASSGQLIVGLTPQLRALFAVQVPMKAAGTYQPPAPAPAVSTFAEVPIAGQLTVTGKAMLPDVGILFDTGAPPITFHPGPDLPSDYVANTGDNVLLQVRPDQPYDVLNITAGPVPCQTQVNMASSPSANDPAGYVNTGLAPFFANPIMFDLANGVIGFVK